MDAEVSESASVAIEGAEVAEESVAASSTFVEGASALAEGMAAILGPAVAILIVVTEIIGTVEAGEMNDNLKKAETNMDSNLKSQNTAIANLKQAFGNLLDCAIEDIKDYNMMIKCELNLSPSKNQFFVSFRGYTPQDGFTYKGLDTYKKGIVDLKDAKSIPVFQGSADSDLKDVAACITAQSFQDSKDTQIITNMKSWLKNHSQTDINDVYISEAIDLFGVDNKRLTYCNKLRQFMNGFAAKMEPYHKAIKQENQEPGTQTKQPDQDPINHHAKPDLTYSADPKDFDFVLE